MTKSGSITNIVMVVVIFILAILQSVIVLTILGIGLLLWILSKALGISWRRL